MDQGGLATGGSDYEFLLNVLNEVLRGLRVDFPAQPGVRREEAAALGDRLRSAHGALTLSWFEVQLLRRATSLCMQEMGEAEFLTRVGMSVQKARLILEALTARQTHAAAS